MAAKVTKLLREQRLYPGLWNPEAMLLYLFFSPTPPYSTATIGPPLATI